MDGRHGLRGVDPAPSHLRKRSTTSISIYLQAPSPVSGPLSLPSDSPGRLMLERLTVPRGGRALGHTYRRLWATVLCLGAGLLLLSALTGVGHHSARTFRGSSVEDAAARSSDWGADEDSLHGAAAGTNKLRLGGQGAASGSQDPDDICATRPCRFVVAGRLGEQETKAQIHLYQLGLLASILNRTVVLPNVDSSRLGTCRKHPFSFYYTADSLTRLGIKTVTQDEFQHWTEQKEKRATAQIITLDRRDRHFGSIVEVNTANASFIPPPFLCANKTRYDFTGHYPVTFLAPPNYRTQRSDDQSQYIDEIVGSLRNNVGAKGSRLKGPAEVFIVDHNVLRYPFLLPDTHVASLTDSALPKFFEHFPYAETWTELAETLIATLSPYVAVHWRTETLPANILAPCGKSLITTLIALKKRHPSLRSVWMSTDYPLDLLDQAEGSLGDGAVAAHSSTYSKLLTPEHHAAMWGFLSSFRAADTGLRLTSFAAEEQLVRLPPAVVKLLPPDGDGLKPVDRRLRSVDSAPVGIVDKLVSSRAALFLAGESGFKNSQLVPGSCGKLSSFTDQIIGAREDAWEQGKSEDLAKDPLWNTVTRWSNPQGGR